MKNELTFIIISYYSRNKILYKIKKIKLNFFNGIKVQFQFQTKMSKSC